MKTTRENRSGCVGNGLFLSDLLVIAAIWILAVIATNPVGNFPLNDDWSFGLTVRRLLENGYYNPCDWAAMPLISHIIWGWLFSVPLGFSFDVLRLSTLTASLFGLFCIYWLIRDLTKKRWLTALSTLAIAFNPIYFALSHTFMTDVPFTTFLVIAILFLWRYLKSQCSVDLLAGTIACLISILSRQLALAVPIAFAFTAIALNLRQGGLSRNSLFTACLPALVSLAGLKLFEAWLRANGIMTALYNSKTVELLRNLAHPRHLVELIASNGFSIIVYLGLFLLPVLLIVACELWRSHRTAFFPWVIRGSVVVIAAWLINFRLSSVILMPFLRNILDSAGIGPLTLRDTYISRLPNIEKLPWLMWLALTLLAFIGGSLLLGCVLYRINASFRIRRYPERALGVSAFFWCASAIYIAPLLLAYIIDRYIIPVIPIVAAAILSQPELAGAFRSPRLLPNHCVTWAMVIAFALFSIITTHDYLAWNRARWTAIDSLSTDRQTLSDRLDGGFEFNGFYAYDPHYKTSSTHSWWWVKDDEMMLSFGPVKGWSIIKTVPYRHILPSKYGAVHVLLKDSELIKHAHPK